MLNQPLVQDDTPNRRRLTEQAINLALQARWEQAVEVNRLLVMHFRDDADAYNRLGKALTELGRYAEARDAYQHALDIDKGNTIARRNLDRLAILATSTPTGTAPRRDVQEKIDPHLFIEETGKTGTTTLVNTAPADELARMTTGDVVYLKPDGRTLNVETASGVLVGQVEPKLGQRLLTLIQGGNKYAAALTSVDDHGVKIIIRETYQDPSQVGKISFPARAESGTFRSYTRDTLLRDEEEDDDDEDEAGEDGEAEFGAERYRDHDDSDGDVYDDQEEI